MSKKNYVCPPLTINGRQPGKKQTDKETTLEKTINGRQPGKKQTDKETTLEKNN
jgi:hypothetical protein